MEKPVNSSKEAEKKGSAQEVVEDLNFEDFKLENVLSEVAEVDVPKIPITEDQVKKEEKDKTSDAKKAEDEEEEEEENVDPELAESGDEDDDDGEDQQETIEKKSPTKTKETKGDVAEGEDDKSEDKADFTPFYALLHQELGWEVKEENVPGASIKDFVSYMEKIVEENVTDKLNGVLSIGGGHLRRFYEFLKSGGDPDQYMDTYYGRVNYEDVKIEDGDDRTQRAVVEDYLRLTEEDAEEVDKTVKDYETSGILQKESERALKKLQKIQKDEKDSLLRNQQELASRRQVEAKTYWDSVQQAISTAESIGPFPIVKKDKTDFFSYLHDVGRDNLTQYQRDLKVDKEASIKMAYMLFKKFDVEPVKKGAKNEVISEVKKNLSRFSAGTGKRGVVQSKEAAKSGDFTDFSLGNLHKQS